MYLANDLIQLVVTLGTLVFQPDEVEKTFPLTIIDDDVYEEDEHFYVKLGNVRYSTDNTSMYRHIHIWVDNYQLYK